ncbi:antitoxin VbhA family protein [Tuberibacillus calidus]|jgi:hypothetical protein|uniref:antitoxin VbhA family protein n=1 Tax=Tuberibacillus calidus TaxID=340097 RepID=UPI00040A51EB|nr:antitoxin VbhA family protein [Tuberibacillus calidus]
MSKEELIQIAIEEGIHSCELEGFEFTEEEKKLVADCLRGKISYDELIRRTLKSLGYR